MKSVSFFIAVGAAMVVPLAASAADPDGAKPTAEARTLAMALDPDASASIDSGAVRAALQSGLGVAVTEGAAGRGGTIRFQRRAEGIVTIFFERPDGRTAERTIDLPPDRALAAETLALAAGNLVRDEAAEILATLDPPVLPAAAGDVAGPEKGTDGGPAPARRLKMCADGERIFFGADFLPFAGTSSVYPDRVRTLSLNFLAGYTRGVHGFELAVGANIDTSFLCGAQIAAGANVVLGNVRGVQVGVVDVALGTVTGSQAAVVNVAKGDVEGAQVGVVSVAGGALVGAQVSVVNVLAGSLRGSQTGVVNVVTADAEGAQVGVVNVASGEVRGPQIGVVNYAERSDYPIGVVSVVRQGRTSVDGWGTETGLAMAGVRHGGRVFHNVYGVGFRAGDPAAWAFALGLGARAPLGPKLHLDVDLTHYWLQRETPFVEEAGVSTLAASFGYALTEELGFFVAPTFNLLITQDARFRNLGPVWGTFPMYQSSETLVRSWVGANLGIRVTL